MEKIPLFDFERSKHRFDDALKVHKAGNVKGTHVSLNNKKLPVSVSLSSKGTIAITNFSAINPVLRPIIESHYNYSRITRVLTMEEHLEFQKILGLDLASLTSDTVKVFNDFIKNNGIVVGTSNYKKQANVCILRLEGVKQPEIDFAIGKDLYWPTKFHHLRPLLRALNDPEFATRSVSDQLIRTILGVSRIPEDYGEINLEHILVKNQLKGSVIQEFDRYVEFRVNHPTQGIPGLRSGKWLNWPVRPNARTATFGPNGMNKLQTASFEAALLIKDKLGVPFKKLCLLTNNIPFYEYVERLGNTYSTQFEIQCKLNESLPKSEIPIDIISKKSPKSKRRLDILEKRKTSFLTKILSKVVDKETVSRVLEATKKDRQTESEISGKVSPKPITMYSDPLKGSLRTITAVPDAGNKSRTIAICDIFTQLLLTPFEELLIEFLDKMFGKCSSFHNHQKGFKKFSGKITPGIKSIDFTSWTDYLPAILQKIVLKHMFGPEIADAWYELVVKCEWNSKSHDKPIVYGTGQGMGTKGSFLIASITDHFISEMLLSKCYPDKVRTSPINQLYSRVGDDLWIWDPDDLISQHLESDFKMKINRTKSKTATTSNICGEYVSMNINYGENVSRISIRNILDVRSSLYDVIPLIKHLQERSNIDIGLLLDSLWEAEFYPPKVWSNLYKGLCLEQFVWELKPYKRDLLEGLRRLNAVHNFSVMGQEPYYELKTHSKSDQIRLLIGIFSLYKDAREIKSAVLRIRGVDLKTIRHWSDAVIHVNRDSTIWDTSINLTELITWCQYVDSSDLQDSIDPDTLLYEILAQPDCHSALKLLDQFRSKLVDARANLTYSKLKGFDPRQKDVVKSIEFVSISNHVVIDTVDNIPVLKILGDGFIIDEFCITDLSADISQLGEMIFTGTKTRTEAKGFPLVTAEF